MYYACGLQRRFQDFPGGGGRQRQKLAPTYYLAKFCHKLHEMKKIGSGARAENYTVWFGGRGGFFERMQADVERKVCT